MGTPLDLVVTPARKAFKTRAGQNNHFVVTVLVGLDAVRTGEATLSDEFSTSWSPHDPARSADRSRAYVLTTSLAWITDLVDVYRKRVSRTPGLLSAATVRRIEKHEGRAKKLRELAKELGVDESSSELLVALGIHWRNRIVHSDATDHLNGRVRAELLRQEELIAERHRGLIVDQTIARAERGDAPTFKDVTSIIAAAHQVVQDIDSVVVESLAPDDYAVAWLAQELRLQFGAGDTNAYAKTWPGSPEKTTKRLTQLLLQGHMSRVEPGARRVTPELFSRLASMSAMEARSFLDARIEQA